MSLEKQMSLIAMSDSERMSKWVMDCDIQQVKSFCGLETITMNQVRSVVEKLAEDIPMAIRTQIRNALQRNSNVIAEGMQLQNRQVTPPPLYYAERLSDEVVHNQVSIIQGTEASS